MLHLVAQTWNGHKLDKITYNEANKWLDKKPKTKT
jgi:hypothetical protein